MINTYDIDGVLFMGEYDGVRPGPNDHIITGRSFEEKEETERFLTSKGIYNTIWLNPLRFSEKTRESSGCHKAKTLEMLKRAGYVIGIHFEDDPIQAEIISLMHPDINVVLLVHDLVTKENVRHR